MLKGQGHTWLPEHLAPLAVGNPQDHSNRMGGIGRHITLACHSIRMTFRDLLCEAGGIIILTWPRAPEDSQGRSHIHTVPRSPVILGFEVSQSQHRNGVNGLLLSKRPSSMS